MIRVRHSAQREQGIGAMTDLMAYKDRNAELRMFCHPFDLFALCFSEDGGVHQKKTNTLNAGIKVFPDWLAKLLANMDIPSYVPTPTYHIVNVMQHITSDLDPCSTGIWLARAEDLSKEWDQLSAGPLIVQPSRHLERGGPRSYIGKWSSTCR